MCSNLISRFKITVLHLIREVKYVALYYISSENIIYLHHSRQQHTLHIFKLQQQFLKVLVIQKRYILIKRTSSLRNLYCVSVPNEKKVGGRCSSACDDPNAVCRNGVCVCKPGFGVDRGDLRCSECTVCACCCCCCC